MAKARQTEQRLSMQAPIRGIEQRDTLIQPGQLKECVNLLPVDGELRTRGGQRWIGNANYPLRTDWHDGTNLNAAMGAVSTWYFAARLDNTGVALEENEGMWRCYRYWLTITLPVGAAAFGFTTEYWNGTAWVALPLRMFQFVSSDDTRTMSQVSSMTPDAGGNSYVMLALNANDSRPYGGDQFFDEWVASAVNGTTRYWIRATVTAGSALNLQIGLGGASNDAYLPVRPQSMLHFVDGIGRSQLAVQTALPVPRGSTDDAVAAPAFVNNNRHIGFFSELVLRDSRQGTSDSFARVTEAQATLRDNAHLFYRDTGWLARTKETNSIPHAGRIPLPPESIAYLEVTQRLLFTSHGGVGSMSIDYGGQEQLTSQTTRDFRRFVVERYPRGVTDDGRFSDIFQMRNIGRPVAVAEYNGFVFFGYGDGVVRWTAPQPFDDVVSDLAFTYCADEDGANLVALVPWNGYLVAFMSDSIWLIEDAGSQLAVNFQNHVARKIVSGTGCVGAQAWCIAEGLLYFLSHDGVYAFDGSPVPRRISDSLRTTFTSSLSKPGMYRACAEFDRARRQLWFSVARSGSYWNDLVMVYDLTTQGWYFLEGINAEAMTYDSLAEVLYTCNAGGDVFAQGYGAADGFAGETRIAWRLETGPLIPDFESRRPLGVNLFTRHYPGTAYTVAVFENGVERFTDTFDQDKSTASHPPADVTERAWGASGFSYTTDIPPSARRRKHTIPIKWDSNEVALRLRNASTATAGQRISLLALEVRFDALPDR